MNGHNEKTLFSIIQLALSDKQSCDIDYNSVSDELLLDLIQITNMHDITHLLAFGLLKDNLIDEEIKPQFQQVIQNTVERYERIDTELKRIIEAFETNKIPFIPLKGSVIRKFYPEPWMRTSCDIDVLVKEEDLERARLCLEEQCGYLTEEKKGFHDISLYSPNQVHLELHFNIKEDNELLDNVLSEVWKYSISLEDKGYQYNLSNEFFMFYIIAHMSYHFMTGGCGIRPLIDLYLIEKQIKYDRKIFISLLDKANIVKFYKNVKALVGVWFENNEHTDITFLMQSYIIQGGVYGTLKNMVLLQQQRKKGKLSYFLYKIFLPYSKLKQKYTVIEKYRWLTPVMQVHRWFSIIFFGRAKKAVKELSYNQSVSKSESEIMKKFLEELGL